MMIFILRILLCAHIIPLGFTSSKVSPLGEGMEKGESHQLHELESFRDLKIIESKKSRSFGGQGGAPFEDQIRDGDFELKKIIITAVNSVNSIQIVMDQEGIEVSNPVHGKSAGDTYEFYPSAPISYVSIAYNPDRGVDAIKFFMGDGTNSSWYGNPDCIDKTISNLAINGSISGVYGYADDHIKNLGFLFVIRCNIDTDCQSSAPRCYFGKCVECTLNQHCDQSAPYCIDSKCVSSEYFGVIGKTVAFGGGGGTPVEDKDLDLSYSFKKLILYADDVLGAISVVVTKGGRDIGLKLHGTTYGYRYEIIPSAPIYRIDIRYNKFFVLGAMRFAMKDGNVTRWYGNETHAYDTPATITIDGEIVGVYGRFGALVDKLGFKIRVNNQNCTADSDCNDSAKPHCNFGRCSPCGICPPETPICSCGNCVYCMSDKQCALYESCLNGKCSRVIEKSQLIGDSNGIKFEDPDRDTSFGLSKIRISIQDSISAIQTIFEKKGENYFNPWVGVNNSEVQEFKPPTHISSVEIYYNQTQSLGAIRFRTIDGINSQWFGNPNKTGNQRGEISILGKIIGVYGTTEKQIKSLGFKVYLECSENIDCITLGMQYCYQRRCLTEFEYLMSITPLDITSEEEAEMNPLDRLMLQIIAGIILIIIVFKFTALIKKLVSKARGRGEISYHQAGLNNLNSQAGFVIQEDSHIDEKIAKEEEKLAIEMAKAELNL